MCGILGVAAERPVEPALLDAVDLMRHRGPDGDGRHVSGDVALAMRRLAIIDLETGDQPVANEAEDVVAIVNGELYNYRELRRDLAAQGHVFRGQGDVEVVPHLYEQHGLACFERLRGMFAIALWDEPRRRLVLARDRFGIKPLYVAERAGELLFASELAPLLAAGVPPDVDEEAILDYLALGYVPAPASGLRGVRRLLPGHMLVREGGEVREEPYWRLEPRRGDDLERVLREAVALHLRSDVPLGVLLSGGIDSSLVAALASDELAEPLRTYTVGFADVELDERAHARAVADAVGSRHHELLVETAVADDLPEIAARLEQPLADAAAIPLWYLCRAVGAEVKVALAGDGGDEVFGGYSRYAWDPKAARLGRVLPAGAIARLVGAFPHGGGRRNVLRRASKLLRHAAKPEAERYFSWFTLTDDARAGVFGRLLDEAPPALSRLGRLQYVDLYSMLADNLMLKADKLSMAHSLELRVPFLDHRVVETGLGLPDRAKVRGVTTKVALRRLVEARLPRPIARRPKQGFDPPVDRWLREELRDLAADALPNASGFVDVPAAKRLLDRHARGEVQAGQQLYAHVMLGLWRAGLRSARALPV